jgi:hypothetical protein
MLKLDGAWVPLAAFGGFFTVLFVVFQVVDMEFFRGDPNAGGSATPIPNASVPQDASNLCMTSVAKELGVGSDIQTKTAFTTWDLGFGRLLIRGIVRGPGKAQPTRTFLCRLQHLGDDSGPRYELQSLELVD